MKAPLIAAVALVAIAAHLLLRVMWPGLAWAGLPAQQWPLFAALAIGGVPLVYGLARKLIAGDFSSDLLAGISIATAVLLGEYLAGTLVVLMLSGGQTIEAYAVGRASSALSALARRIPTVAHKKTGDTMADVPLEAIELGDTVVVFPHEACPVDGVVVKAAARLSGQR
ncbi:MAG: hypothetical protein EXQ49_01445 [Acidobacteria bacterium]|nr:hypothetical protein [Acidobacteriota bacterium]